MKKTALFLGLSALVLALATTEADGRGCCRSAGCCYTPCCYTPCYNVSYVDQVCTGYRCETRSKVVPVNVTECVTKAVQEPYTYTVYEQVMVPQTRKVTYYSHVWVDQPFTYTVYEQVQVPHVQKVAYCEHVWVDQPYTYTMYEQVMVPHKRTVNYYKHVWVDQPYTYTECVPVVTPQTYQVTHYTHVPKTVVVQQTVCSGYNTCYVGGCGGCCYPVCTPCYSTVACPVTTYECVPVVKNVTVNVTSYQHVQKQGSRKVCQVVAEPREEVYHVCQLNPKQMQGVQKVCQTVTKYRDVTYYTCQLNAKQMQGTRKVCQTVPQVREETYNVCQLNPKQMQGTYTRYICEHVVKTVNVTQYYNEMVPYNYTVRVPVCTPVAPACYPGGYCH